MPHNRAPKPGAKYYLPKYRYKTVVNFCLQYQELKEELKHLDGWHSGRNDGMPRGNNVSDPTYSDAVRRKELQEKIDIIESSVREAAGFLYAYMLPGVTDENMTYNKLRTIHGIPVNHKEFSLLRRKVYYMISKKM